MKSNRMLCGVRWHLLRHLQLILRVSYLFLLLPFVCSGHGRIASLHRRDPKSAWSFWFEELYGPLVFKAPSQPTDRLLNQKRRLMGRSQPFWSQVARISIWTPICRVSNLVWRLDLGWGLQRFNAIAEIWLLRNAYTWWNSLRGFCLYAKNLFKEL